MTSPLPDPPHVHEGHEPGQADVGGPAADQQHHPGPVPWGGLAHHRLRKGTSPVASPLLTYYVFPFVLTYTLIAQR